MKREQSDTEDRDQQVLRRLSNIEHKVNALEQTYAFSLRADEKRHFEAVKKVFGKSKRRAQVYLAANNQRAVQDIANMFGVPQESVSRELGKLREEGLLEVIEREGGKTYWGKTPVDRTLRISPFLMKEYNLDKNGRMI